MSIQVLSLKSMLTSSHYYYIFMSIITLWRAWIYIYEPWLWVPKFIFSYNLHIKLLRYWRLEILKLTYHILKTSAPLGTGTDIVRWAYYHKIVSNCMKSNHTKLLINSHLNFNSFHILTFSKKSSSHCWN